MLYSNGQFFQGTFCVDNATENETCQIPPWKVINRKVEYKSHLKSIEKGFLYYSFTSIRQHPNNKSLTISRFFRLVIIINLFVLLLLMLNTLMIQIPEIIQCQTSKLSA